MEEEGSELFEHFKIVADKGQEPLRVDKFLLNRLEGTSRNKIQQASSDGFIRVNDKSVKSNYKVKPFDVVSVMFTNPPRDRAHSPRYSFKYCLRRSRHCHCQQKSRYGSSSWLW